MKCIHFVLASFFVVSTLAAPTTVYRSSLQARGSDEVYERRDLQLLQARGGGKKQRSLSDLKKKLTSSASNLASRFKASAPAPEAPPPPIPVPSHDDRQQQEAALDRTRKSARKLEKLTGSTVYTSTHPPPLQVPSGPHDDEEQRKAALQRTQRSADKIKQLTGSTVQIQDPGKGKSASQPTPAASSKPKPEPIRVDTAPAALSPPSALSGTSARSDPFSDHHPPLSANDPSPQFSQFSRTDSPTSMSSKGSKH